jgi:hypothetical protein
MSLVSIAKKDMTSYLLDIPLRSAVSGQLYPNIAYNAVSIYYQRQGAVAPVMVNTVAGTPGTWASGAWSETIPGIYQFGVPNAAIATGADYVLISIAGNGIMDAVMIVYLTASDMQDDTIGLITTALGTIRLNYTAVAASMGSALDIIRKRGDTWSISITGLGSLVGYTSIWFTVKNNYYQPDLDAVFMIRKNASGSGDGLLRLNGAACTDLDNFTPLGYITIDDINAGDITVTVDETVSSRIASGIYQADIQTLISSLVATPFFGKFTVENDVTFGTT